MVCFFARSPIKTVKTAHGQRPMTTLYDYSTTHPIHTKIKPVFQEVKLTAVSYSRRL